MARLIDTSVVIQFERSGHPPEMISVLAAGQYIGLASITASELLAGIERADSIEHRERRAAFVEEVFRRVPTISFDLQVARVHARLGAQLLTIGRPIGANDLLIAATALSHGMSVLTENLRDFERVPGLIVERPGW
jgi:predicted nucleic acid-binding protein